MIARCEKFVDLDAATTSTTLKTTFTAWSLQFPSAAHSKGPDRRTQAPLDEKIGLADMEPLLGQLVPPSASRVNFESFPKLKHGTTASWLFGFMPDMITHLPEPACLGTVRLQISGELAVACVAANTLHQHLLAVDGCYTDKDKPTISEMLAFMSTVDQAKITTAEESGCSIRHGTVADHSALFVPPGYIVSMKPLNGQKVYGVRRSWAVTTPDIRASMKVLAAAHANADLPDDAQQLEEVLTAMGPP